MQSRLYPWFLLLAAAVLFACSGGSGSPADGDAGGGDDGQVIEDGDAGTADDGSTGGDDAGLILDGDAVGSDAADIGPGDDGGDAGGDVGGDTAPDGAGGDAAGDEDEPTCLDTCLLPIEGPGDCGLWDEGSQSFLDVIEDGDGHMHNRARRYTSWLRERLMPEGGVMRVLFTDSTLANVNMYAGTRDSPIWTGIYLGAEALRYMITGAPDAKEQIARTVRTLHRWWNISGDPGYLARYAVPSDAPQKVLDIFDPDDPEFHFDVPFEGETWHWRGNTSRDQYQGVMFGMSLAYQATDDEEIREIIREDVVEFIEQLIKLETRTFIVKIGAVPVPTDIEVQYVVYTDDETEDGLPHLDIQLNPFDFVDDGFLQFWPDPMKYLHQIQGLSWVPNFYLRSQAVQLGGMISVALQVTEGVPAYAQRRAAILAHYEEAFEELHGLASGWINSNNCGDSYHGLNIAFLPGFLWAKNETDPQRKARVQTEVLRDRLWAEVQDHKNVFFAFMYASQAHSSDGVSGAVQTHLDQLRQFPTAPNLDRPVDNSGTYPEDPDCEGLSSIAIDVADRVPSTFMWERNPWKLYNQGVDNFVYSGVDYLITYWMARYYQYLEDDAPGTCLKPR